MNYAEFKRSATRYVEDNFGSLDVLNVHNDYVKGKVHKYMFTLMFEEYKPSPEDSIEIMNKCQEYENVFYRECLK